MAGPDAYCSSEETGQPGAFVAPAARDHGGPGAAAAGSAAIGGKPAGVPTHAEAWQAARAQALSPERQASLYADYVAGKQALIDARQAAALKRAAAGKPAATKPPAPVQIRPQAQWWGLPGQPGGARHPVEGCLGEYQADQLFAALGHTKLNHGGQLVGLLDPPKGPGLDGVWRNGAPPPEYFITDTKTTTKPGAKPPLPKVQLSNKWIFDENRLEKAVGKANTLNIELANAAGQVGKRLLHINSDGQLTQYDVSLNGKLTPLG